jgi:hypothetical protein
MDLPRQSGRVSLEKLSGIQPSCLILRWADVTQRRIARSPIVPRLDVAEDGPSGFPSGAPVALPEQLELQRGENPFRNGVIVSSRSCR